MTQTSAVIGTAQYLSPEQARGEAVDARSDVYAAGCVLFELLCGHPPFVGDSPVSVAYQHVREDPRPPSYINPEVGPDIDAVVLKALAKNPLNRYQSAGEMRNDALRAAAGRAVMATPVLSEDETIAMSSPQSRPLGGSRGGDPRRQRASAWVLAALSALGVLAVIALAAGLLLNNKSDDPAKIAVPNVIDQDRAGAERALTAVGLAIADGEPVKDADCTVGRVADQSPKPGDDPLAKGDAVTVNLCVGPDSVKVPIDLVGARWQDAEARLLDLKLKPERVAVDSGKDKDEVLEVEKQGLSVPVNTRIRVEVSRANLNNVPNVVGLTQADAEERLEEAGFNVRVTAGKANAEQAGRVTSQDPRSDNEAKVDSTVTIVVAQEPEEDPEPTAEPTSPGPILPTIIP
jgi:serine/threonine-protein kinase